MPVLGPQGPRGSPQWRFLESRADIVIFNGQPGSGKTAALTLDLLRGAKLPLFRGAAFRRQAKQLAGAGSLWDLATRWYPHAGGELVASPNHMVKFPSGATIEYHHLNQEKDKEAHDGKSYEALVFDELPHFSASQFWYLAGSRNRGVSGYKPTVRASTMAAPDTWVHELVRPWLDAEGGWPNWDMSGVVKWFVRNPFDDKLVWFSSAEEANIYVQMIVADAHPNDPVRKMRPKSFTVVHAVTADNRILLGSAANYEADIAMLTRYERERLAGNWNARPPSAGMFDRRNFAVLDDMPSQDQIVFSVRGWDRAATKPSEVNDDPDWSRGVRLDLLRNGQVVISDVVSLRDRPGAVNRLMRATAALDGPYVTQAMWINPGDSGIFERDALEEELRSVQGCGPRRFLRQTQNKEAYVRPCAAFFDPERAGGKRGAVLRAAWNGECFAEAEMFPLKKHPVSGEELHDDFVDALSRAFIEIETRRSGTFLDWARADVS